MMRVTKLLSFILFAIMFQTAVAQSYTNFGAEYNGIHLAETDEGEVFVMNQYDAPIIAASEIRIEFKEFTEAVKSSGMPADDRNLIVRILQVLTNEHERTTAIHDLMKTFKAVNMLMLELYDEQLTEMYTKRELKKLKKKKK
ncbi:MAG: hypothetical protein QNK23_18425 [Crocinitomicaceae bacterium]|nr:hypothetical protein [Crocinitomicaceae bacterium]